MTPEYPKGWIRRPRRRFVFPPGLWTEVLYRFARILRDQREEEESYVEADAVGLDDIYGLPKEAECLLHCHHIKGDLLNLSRLVFSLPELIGLISMVVLVRVYTKIKVDVTQRRSWLWKWGAWASRNWGPSVRRVIGCVLLNFSVCGTTRLSQYIFPLVGPGRIIGLQGTDTFHLTPSFPLWQSVQIPHRNGDMHQETARNRPAAADRAYAWSSR